MRLLICVLLGLLAVGTSPVAKGQTWLLCDNCSSASDFEQAALQESPAAVNSVYLFAVGNTNSGVFRWVEIRTYNDGGGFPIDPLRAAPGKGRNLVVRGRGRKPSDLQLSTSSVAYDVTSIEASAEEKQAFVSITKANDESPVAPPPGENVYGFDSFASADMVAVGKYLWAFKTALDPKWQASYFSEGWKSLWDFYKLLRGQGPAQCIVFRNGDSACYQLNPMDPNAPRYLTGSAKNIAGISLTGEPTGGGIGDGEPLTIIQNSVNEYRWSTGESWLWLVCTFQGGNLISCYTIVLVTP